jgi:hypothetical protein
MALLKALGKKELKELGCNFIVINVPVFAAMYDTKKIIKMEVNRFKTVDEVKEFMGKNLPIAIFDQTGVYKEKADRVVKDLSSDMFSVRCAKLTPTEFESIKKNVKLAENFTTTYNIDFSCWYNGNI